MSEEVETTTTSPVDAVAGLETSLAVISNVSPPAMVPQLPYVLKVTVAPPLLVTTL